MIQQKASIIRNFCLQHANQSNIEKYSRYFKEGFDGYGLDMKIFESQRDKWVEEWRAEMSLNKYLDLGKQLVADGKYEEVSFAIMFIASYRSEFSIQTFHAIGEWFTVGINNWASTDVLCMMVLASFFKDEIVSFDELKTWCNATSQWQRRCVPVTLVELLKDGLEPNKAFPIIEPLMTDKSEYVQKGIGTLLRGLWKTYPVEIEDFLLKWKDVCGRLIVQYATEKMSKESRARFKKAR